jgi:hypothetical protein
MLRHMSDFAPEQKVVFHGTRSPVFRFVEYLTETRQMAYIRAPLSGKLDVVYSTDLVPHPPKVPQ